VNILWQELAPIGICVFGFGPLSSAQRNVVFGLRGRLTRARAERINRNFASVARLALDPRYRGCGIAAGFLRRACQLAPWPWIELVSEMANLVPFCEAAGFVRVGQGVDKSRTLGSRPGDKRSCWGKSNWTDATFAAYARCARFSRPAYYLFDNRRNIAAADQG